jgi:hypothetical protein
VLVVPGSVFGLLSPVPDAPGADSNDGAGVPVVDVGELPFGVGTAPTPPLGP